MQDSNTKPPISIWQTVNLLAHPRVVTMLFLGFSAGIPILLIFSSLSLWLIEAGVERNSVTFFSWAALGYSFKFVWAPLIDKLPLPFLTSFLGRRRAWILLSQILIILAIVFMANINPAIDTQDSLVLMALSAVLLGFSSATQDIVIDAYRIESAEIRLQALMSSTYVAGYRIAMITAGAGALYLASYLGSNKSQYLYSAWQTTYLIMAGFMLIGIITTLSINEPLASNVNKFIYKNTDYLRMVLVFICAVTGFALCFFYSSTFVDNINKYLNSGALLKFIVEVIRFFTAIIVAFSIGYFLFKIKLVNKEIATETWVLPIVDFFKRYGISTSLIILSLIGLYRISDIVLGVISNVFYQNIGFSKEEIATAVKVYGVVMTIFGGFVGGLYATRFGVIKTLLWGAILSALTNLLFILLALRGHDVGLMYFTVSADNLAAGFATTAFVAFLSSLVNVSFTAIQYAIFSSLMTLLPKIIGGYSGTIVNNIGYPYFFMFTAIIGLPVIILIFYAKKHLQISANQ